MRCDQIELAANYFFSLRTFLLSHPTDWLLFYDQFVLGRHCDAIFRDEEARDGANAARAGTLHLLIDTGVEHQQFRADDVLRGDRQVHRAPLPTPQTPFD